MSIILSVIFVLSLVGIDQIIKYFVIEYLKPVGVVEFIEGFIRFRYVENTGAVFGSFSTHTALLTADVTSSTIPRTASSPAKWVVSRLRVSAKWVLTLL